MICYFNIFYKNLYLKIEKLEFWKNHVTINNRQKLTPLKAIQDARLRIFKTLDPKTYFFNSGQLGEI